MEKSKFLSLTLCGLTLCCLALCGLALCGLSISAQTAYGDGFSHKGVTWGATEAQVKSAEATAPRSEGGVGDVRILVFSSKLQGEDANALYRFAGGKLFQISYVLAAKGRSCQEILPLYEKAVTDLSAQFGAGSESELEGPKPCNKQRHWSAPMTNVSAKISNASRLTDLEVVYSSEGANGGQSLK